MVKASVSHLQERLTIANAVYGSTVDALLGLKLSLTEAVQTRNIDAAVGAV